MLACRVLVMAAILAQCFTSPYFPTMAKKKCSHTRSHKLLAADCHGMNLESVPLYLHSDIQILDLSFNRIRELHRKDFINYSYVTILYLGENFISYIEANTFGELKYLEVVNMSLNAIHAIPPELFHLPNLRKLTMDYNQLSPDKFNDLATLPTMFNLKFLSLANCKLNVFPPLQKFPHIEFLNISGNALVTISPSQIAPACLLTKIDLNGNDQLFSFPSCNCTALKHWASQKDISVQPPFDVLCSSIKSGPDDACTNTSLMGTNELYSSCRVAHSALQTQATWTQVWLYVAIAAAILSIVILSFMYYRRYCRKSLPPLAANHLDEPLPNQPESNKNLLIHSDS